MPTWRPVLTQHLAVGGGCLEGLGAGPAAIPCPGLAGDQNAARRHVAILPGPCCPLPRPGQGLHARSEPTPQAPSPAAVQPHVPATQPRPVVLVLVGGEVLDDGRDPGLQRVGVLVRAVPAAQHGVGGTGSVRGALTAWGAPHPSGQRSEKVRHATPGVRCRLGARKEAPALHPLG